MSCCSSRPPPKKAHQKSPPADADAEAKAAAKAKAEGLLADGREREALAKAAHEKQQQAENSRHDLPARLLAAGYDTKMSKEDMIKKIQKDSTVAFQRANHCYGQDLARLKSSMNTEDLVGALEDLADKKK